MGKYDFKDRDRYGFSFEEVVNMEEIEVYIDKWCLRLFRESELKELNLSWALMVAFERAFQTPLISLLRDESAKQLETFYTHREPISVSVSKELAKMWYDYKELRPYLIRAIEFELYKYYREQEAKHKNK